KIYIVTYPTVITPSGRRKPGANADIIKGWNEGRLVINYVGHGSADLWAHEHIFVRDETIPQLHNNSKLPLVTIASCDLLRWDDPFSISAGEQLVIIKDGAIGVIGANRPVYSQYNATFNNYLWDHFTYDKDTLNLPIRIGKALYRCKLNINLSDNDTKYGLEGDPTVRVSIPQHITMIDSINKTSTIDPTIVDTIKALQKVEFKGRILYPDSSFWSTYNGEITIKIFDVDKNVTFYDFGWPFYFRLDGGTIFKGKTKIINGKWTIKFIVPRDISYTTGNGKLLSYFTDRISEGSGYTDRFVLNGIDTTAVVDSTGPIINAFIDNRNFRSGDVVNQNTKIIADFFDVNGINLTGQIGHKLEAVINDDENSKIDLTPYYNSDTSYQHGSLEYPMQNLADGKFKLKIRAWDTYNNLSESVLYYTVKSNSDLFVDKVYNYPNPFKDFTSFTFQHNLDSRVSVKIKIYTVSGRLIKEITRTNIADKNVILDWDGRDNDSDAIANGTYIYKITIKSDDGLFNKTSTGILAKLK
ncbi:MAG: C25 family cysteine peptidase, partial [Ignavibacteriae bacterium]|nr:C25 family cysteine peptidase [Ignavibacteriota bacterium]